MNGTLTQILQCQRVEVMTTPRRIENIGFEHGVLVNAAKPNIMIGQYIGVVLQMLADFGNPLILKQWLQCVEHLVAAQLVWGTRVIMRQRHISCRTRLHCEGDTHNLCDHVIQAGRLGIKCNQGCPFQLEQPVIKSRLIEHGRYLDLLACPSRLSIRYLALGLLICCGGLCAISALQQGLKPGLELQLTEQGNHRLLIGGA